MSYFNTPDLNPKANKTDIATVESGTTASRAYSVGELVYVNDTLYRVKTAITSGATFTVGTNIEAKNVSGAIDEVNRIKQITANSVSISGNTITDFCNNLKDWVITNLPENACFSVNGAWAAHGYFCAFGDTGSTDIHFEVQFVTSMYYYMYRRSIQTSYLYNVATINDISKINKHLVNIFTFTSGRRSINITQFTGERIKNVTNVFPNTDVPMHFYVEDSTASAFTITMVLDGSSAGYTGDVSLQIVYDGLIGSSQIFLKQRRKNYEVFNHQSSKRKLFY